MVDTGIFATTAEVQRRAGAKASAVSNVEAYINDFMTQAESYINTVCKFNFSDVYSTLNADVKAILKECAACLAAIDVIIYDTSNFGSASQANLSVNVLWAKADKCLNELKEKDKQSFIRSA